MLHGKSGEVEQEDDTTTTTVPNSQAAVKKAKAAATPVQIDLDEHGASQLAEDEDALFEAQMLLQKQQASKRKMFFAGKECSEHCRSNWETLTTSGCQR